MSRLAQTLTPFLYPSLDASWAVGCRQTAVSFTQTQRHFSNSSSSKSSSYSTSEASSGSDPTPESRLNPSPEDYSRSVFADKCRLILQAGNGGHGCVSFLREKFIPAGPPNGGDGGSGGSIYIQSVKGETSLHKLAYQRIFKAPRGRNGQGKSKGGQRGEDMLIQVPIGTVVREVARMDPVAIEEQAKQLERGDESMEEGLSTEMDAQHELGAQIRKKWIVSPSADPNELKNLRFPRVQARRTHLAAAQPEAPIFLDLSEPMEEPMLLAAGAAGGLGNPHFVTKSTVRPLIATKGETGIRVEVELELKLLADLGFVGLPNAGKSTLLRALTNSRARVGNWAFTTLQPNIGTVVLDDHRGRAKYEVFDADGTRRTQFSIADIPGIVPDAHLDKGLGLDFLRHIERARVLAFVVDLSSGDAVQTLQTLWRELDAFERVKEVDLEPQDRNIVSWSAFGSAIDVDAADEKGERDALQDLPPVPMPPISSKPWFVVATKADVQGTEENFGKLKEYLKGVETGSVEHPTSRKVKWEGKIGLVPISAIRAEGVDKVALQTISLLES